MNHHASTPTITRSLGITAALASSLLAVAHAAGQVNLIANNNFEAGNNAFNSDYGYSAGGNCCEGQYTVRGNGSTFNGSFVNPPPSSTGSSLMMVINGSTTPGLRVWYQTVNVPAAGLYRLTLRGCTAVAGGPAQLNWQVNGALVGSQLTLPTTTANWVTLEADWTAAAPGTIELALRNLNTASFPNDFYIDDLSMTTGVCTPDIGIAGGEFGHDGLLDNNDFIAFINYFFALNALADRGVAGGFPGSDGQFDNNDFIVFITQFFNGCT